MCLMRVDKIYNGTSKEIKTGYKVFDGNDEEDLFLCPAFMPVIKELPVGEWLDERRYRWGISGEGLIIIKGAKYPMGWHVFTRKEDAEDMKKWLDATDSSISYFIIRKVQCKGLLATGCEDDAPVEVYRYIKIEKEV